MTHESPTEHTPTHPVPFNDRFLQTTPLRLTPALKFDERSPDEERKDLYRALMTALDDALPDGAPPRGRRREVFDVLLDTLTVAEARRALRDLGQGAGAELMRDEQGHSAFCTAWSSALMAVNFMAPFTAPTGKIAAGGGALRFEHELRVSGVKAPVGPTLDALVESPGETIGFEFKLAEPWRDARGRSISTQYDAPADLVSPNLLGVIDAIRAGRLSYRYLDAPQLIKHLLGIHSGLNAGTLHWPAKLILVYWRPSDPGRFGHLFDLLEVEFADFASRLLDQSVRLECCSTASLIQEYADDDRAWVREHATQVRARYDTPLST